MKKVINITLGGIVFAIEEDAFASLSQYLEQIKNNLESTDDTKEIVDDIESAIAEKFIAKERSEKVAVTANDVEIVISEMGNPSEFSESGAESADSVDDLNRKAKKRLYRDEDDVVIAGVASGLARYFDIDPVIVRVLFIATTFVSGLGIVVYLVLWLVVPVAETTANKFAMRGERVTLKEISERVKKNLETIEQSKPRETHNLWSGARNILSKVFEILGVVVKFVIQAARYVVGLALIVGGALGVAAMVSAYMVVLLSERVFFPEEVQIAIETLQGSSIGIAAMVASFISMMIPLLVLVIAGASLIAKKSLFTIHKSVTLAVVWIVAIVVAGTASALQVEQVMQKIGPLEDNVHIEIQWDNGIELEGMEEMQVSTSSSAVGEE